MLKPVRKAAGSSRRRNPRRRNRHHAKVPIRTFADWHGPDPGYLEIDLVAHCGGNMAGSFIQSLSVTDVCLGLGGGGSAAGPRADACDRGT